MIFAVILPYINEMIRGFGVEEKKVGVYSAMAVCLLSLIWCDNADRIGISIDDLRSDLGSAFCAPGGLVWPETGVSDLCVLVGSRSSVVWVCGERDGCGRM
jgi:hypothetical protein